MSEPRIVALGGGHGLAASLSALRRLTTELTAIVTVADNGGSSGRLRDEFGVLPPGDLRMALAALCGDDRWGQTWARVLQHRFSSGGELDGHSLGNLLIVSLWDLLGDHVLGLDWVAGLLGARGRVLPMSTTAIDITGRVNDPSAPGGVREVRGQVSVATTAGLRDVSLDPHDPPACPEAVAAIDAADWVVLGPGSWFTSVLPHLLVPGLSDALHRTPARRIVVLNLSAGSGETAGMPVEQHLDVLHGHAPELRIDAVVADPSAVGDVGALVARTDELGARLLLRQVGVSDGGPRHDPLRLAAALRDVVEGTFGDVGTRTGDR